MQKNSKKTKKIIIRYKDAKMWILEQILLMRHKFGPATAKIVVLTTTFFMSTLLSIIIFIASGLIRYEQILIPAFAISNTFLTFHITKPYSNLFNKIL